MSASLVGSEMCIRDSCGRGTYLGRGYCDAPGGCPLPGGPEGPARRATRCLLYTSDAADDM
eukprot:209942-Alexandrium_andersonii.AAC.1